MPQRRHVFIWVAASLTVGLALTGVVLTQDQAIMWPTVAGAGGVCLGGFLVPRTRPRRWVKPTAAPSVQAFSTNTPTLTSNSRDWLDRACLYLDMERNDLARVALRKAYQAALREGQTRRAGEIFMLISRVERAAGRDDAARLAATDACSIFEALGDHAREGDAWFTLLNMADARNDMWTVFTTYSAAYHRYARLPHTVGHPQRQHLTYRLIEVMAAEPNAVVVSRAPQMVTPLHAEAA